MYRLGPIWWNQNGIKMHLREHDPENKELVEIAGGKAILRLVSFRYTNGLRWKVTWSIEHSSPSSDWSVSGSVVFTNSELIRAFDLKTPVTGDILENNHRLLDRYGGDRSIQGKFIGDGRFLNIPMPGTGYDGDPNISIHISDDMKNAVEKLLKT